MEEKSNKRKYVGVGGDDVPSLGVLEGEILRLLWDAGEPRTSVQVFEAMHFSRRTEKREMHAPSTIAVTLSRMVEKRLLTVKRRPHGGKGYYAPTMERAEVVVKVLDDVSRRLTGQPIGYLLTCVSAGCGDEGLAGVVLELTKKMKEDGAKPLPRVKIPEY